jgi:hypothetical protein
MRMMCHPLRHAMDELLNFVLRPFWHLIRYPILAHLAFARDGTIAARAFDGHVFGRHGSGAEARML